MLATALDIVADRCVRALAIGGAYDRAQPFLNLIADAGARLTTTTGLVRQAAISGHVNLVYGLLNETKTPPQYGVRALRPAVVEVACAAEKA